MRYIMTIYYINILLDSLQLSENVNIYPLYTIHYSNVVFLNYNDYYYYKQIESLFCYSFSLKNKSFELKKRYFRRLLFVFKNETKLCNK